MVSSPLKRGKKDIYVKEKIGAEIDSVFLTERGLSLRFESDGDGGALAQSLFFWISRANLRAFFLRATSCVQSPRGEGDCFPELEEELLELYLPAFCSQYGGSVLNSAEFLVLGLSPESLELLNIVQLGDLELFF